MRRVGASFIAMTAGWLVMTLVGVPMVAISQGGAFNEILGAVMLYGFFTVRLITPLATLRLAELLADALPKGVLNVIHGRGATVGDSLINHPASQCIRQRPMQVHSFAEAKVRVGKGLRRHRLTDVGHLGINAFMVNASFQTQVEMLFNDLPRHIPYILETDTGIVLALWVRVAMLGKS